MDSAEKLAESKQSAGREKITRQKVFFFVWIILAHTHTPMSTAEWHVLRVIPRLFVRVILLRTKCMCQEFANVDSFRLFIFVEGKWRGQI